MILLYQVLSSSNGPEQKDSNLCFYICFKFIIYRIRFKKSDYDGKEKKQLGTVCIYTGIVTVKAQLISGNIPQQQHAIQSHPH